MIDTEVLIIGGGAAGLTAAIELSQKHKVSVIAKETIVDSSTWYAQGGIAAVMLYSGQIKKILQVRQSLEVKKRYWSETRYLLLSFASSLSISK